MRGSYALTLLTFAVVGVYLWNRGEVQRAVATERAQHDAHASERARADSVTHDSLDRLGVEIAALRASVSSQRGRDSLGALVPASLAFDAYRAQAESDIATLQDVSRKQFIAISLLAAQHVRDSIELVRLRLDNTRWQAKANPSLPSRLLRDAPFLAAAYVLGKLT